MAAKKITNYRIAILGGGNIGQAMAKGFIESGKVSSRSIAITRRKIEQLNSLKKQGFVVGVDNIKAISNAEIIIIAVRPAEIFGLLDEIAPSLDSNRHVLISVVTGTNIKDIREHVGPKIPVLRVMPNTSIAIRESMTCIACDTTSKSKISIVSGLFDLVGNTMQIDEQLMIPATVICACGIAYFLRAIRAVSQGGVEIGFHPGDAIDLAAQTAKGAAALLMASGKHPEEEVDRVTTPRGITIAGLNQMEHEGFSSAIIRGIIASTQMAEKIAREK